MSLKSSSEHTDGLEKKVRIFFKIFFDFFFAHPSRDATNEWFHPRERRKKYVALYAIDMNL